MDAFNKGRKGMSLHLTIEIPWQIKRHEVAGKIQGLLDKIASGKWSVEEKELIPTTIVPTAYRVRVALRKWTDDQEMRFHAVVQTMRPVISEQFEHLCPLVFMAAVSREGPIGSMIFLDKHAIPDVVERTLERVQKMFGDIKQGPHKYDFDCAARTVLQVVQATGWYNPELQRFWHSIN